MDENNKNKANISSLKTAAHVLSHTHSETFSQAF